MTLSEKTCLVTGANTGLGFAVSKKLAEQGAHTVLVCRNKEKGDSAILEIKRDIPDASVELMICDLSSMKSIQSFIEEFKAKYSKLDILYNNAAVMKQKRTVTEDGFEMMFQVNYLASFILMNSFIELLKNGSSPYIINNGRPADKYRLDMDDLQFMRQYHMYNSFFKTKLCLLFASLELSRRPERDGVTVTMIDPGPFKSDLVRDVPLAGWVKNLFSSPVDKAADNILYHVASGEAEDKNGKVFREKQEKPLTEYWKDTNISKQVWTVTETLIKDKIK
ncbi:MAG: SDR family NAD(P)-dependent oxidoreductase [Bacteroidales bacterium]|nr:MAG: SDR family NAD(P)-dependent oxidoreductase [Bacteroidales bacterium]